MKEFYQTDLTKIYHGNSLNVLKELPDESVQMCVTSPPYWGLRDYGHDEQIGLESTPELYVENLLKIFREVKRVLRKDGTLWLNLGDCYYNYRSGKGQVLVKQSCSNSGQDMPSICARRGNKLNGLKEKDLVGIPWRVAFALQADGWYLRQDIIWHKPNCMPESVTDRCTKSHEYIFLLSKSKQYYYDSEAIKGKATGYDNRKDTVYKGGNKDMAVGKHERWPSTIKIKHKNLKTNGQSNNTMHKRRAEGLSDIDTLSHNKRSVWTVSPKPYKGAHFAVYPPELITPCILAGSRKGDVVIDPFFGSGTTAEVAEKFGRKCIGIELNPEYGNLEKERIAQPYLL